MEENMILESVKITIMVVLAFMFGWQSSSAHFYGQLFEQQAQNVQVMEKRK